MPRIVGGPTASNIKTIKQLANRLKASTWTRDSVSQSNVDVPAWQRQSVWTNDEMGLLALSIILNYPIGLVILWKKPDKVRVPIDGRQRLTAINEFFHGRVAIPDLPGVPEEYKNRKYRLLEGDASKYTRLLLDDREAFADYTPQMVEFDEIDETTAMDVFIRLQGGKSLTKTEVRSALGGRLCDFVTEFATSPPVSSSDSEEEEEEPSARHPFFQQVNIRPVRKAHRNLCDVLLHEHLYPGRNKHWSSLEMMYRDKSQAQ